MLEKKNGLQMSQVFFRVRALSSGDFALPEFFRARSPRPAGTVSSATSISLDLADLGRRLARLAL
jgi:hypothetical protein